MTLDAAVALAVAALCAAWLARRSWRAVRGAGSGCGCGKRAEAPCARSDAMAEGVRDAARRRAATPDGRAAVARIPDGPPAAGM
jgi:hypothetical protein